MRFTPRFSHPLAHPRADGDLRAACGGCVASGHGADPHPRSDATRFAAVPSAAVRGRAAS